jgi:hypothetical protein
MKKNKIVPIISITLMLLLVSLTFGQGTKKYPPYPDVWEREFTDYLGNPSFIPTTDGEVILSPGNKVDRNGEIMRDKSGNPLGVGKSLLFFENKVVSDFKKDIEPRVGGIEGWQRVGSLDYVGKTHSKHLGNMSKDIDFKDGSKIRWIRGMVTDSYGVYQAPLNYQRKEINGVLLYQNEGGFKIDETPHGRYYNRPILLEKVDKDGKVMWQKVYLYFHPWWKHDVWIYDRATEGACDDSYSFCYFKLGSWAVIDEGRMFLYFDGTKKIFRLPELGNPRTNDKNIVVMDYKEYRGFVERIIRGIHNYKKRMGRNISPCSTSTGDGRKGPCDTQLIGDYDYIGEQLSKKFGMNWQSDLVKKIMREHKNLEECIGNYRWMEKSN